MIKQRNKSKEAEEKKTCPVCMDHFTAIIRQPITCPFCPHSICRQCASQFLLSSLDDPHCMDCKREWNREFIDTSLTQTFRKGSLRVHRRKVLMDRERGRLPAMQVFVEAQSTVNRTSTEIGVLRNERRALKRQRNEIQASYKPEEGYDTLANKLHPIVRQLADKKKKIGDLETQYYNARSILIGTGKVEAKQFIMKCPAEECRGFLSTAWKCGTCEKFFCSDCHAQKSGMRDEDHMCNEEAKATASMIRQETKPCPKCGIRISKIDGCFAKNTPILLWDGHYKNSQDIKVGDVLIGDDGEPRIVEELCSGGDQMFEVTQGKGMTYTVNSKHKLALKFSGEKSIHWSESEQAWKVRWFDRDEHIMKSKKSRVDSLFDKEEAYFNLKAFVDSLDFEEVIEITVDDYMRLSEPTKKHLMGFKSPACVSWKEKQLPLDPYLLGVWLGDGINDGMTFAINPEADPEILETILKWCEENKAELIHDEAYRFRIRRREVAKGRLAIGRGATSSECKGCKEKKCTLCDLPEKPYTEEVEVGLRHPLKEQLDKYDLPRKSKYIPLEYLTNSREVRLQLLAGLIDTDGYVGNDGKRIQIPQANHNLGKQIEYLARSLGYVVHTDLLKKTNISFPNYAGKTYTDQYRVNISGDHLSEIPTRVARKRCVNSNSTKDELRTGIIVKSVGQGTYYGWSVSGSNKRFLLGDFTVVRNCDQMWCTECHTTFSWNTGQILLNTVVHNPHYYEYLRKTNGTIPREAGDVPCGGLPYAYQFHQFVNQSAGLTYDQRNKLYMMHQGLTDIFARLPNYALRAPANMNRDIDIDYLMNKIDEDEWGTKLEHMETTFERKKEIGLIIQTLVHIGAEKITSLMNQQLTNAKNRHGACMQTLKEMHEVREFINTSLMKKGVQMCFVVPQINEDFQFKWATKEQMKSEKGKPTKNTTLSSISNEVVEPEPEPEAEAVRLIQPLPSVEEKRDEPSQEPLVEGKVFVEIEGEMVEMTYEQARLIMFIDELKNMV